MVVPKIFGVPRSGSTVVANIVDHLFPNILINQTHKYFVTGPTEKTIVIYRDFRDACTSQWRAYYAGFDEEENKTEIPFPALIKHAREQLITIEILNCFKSDSLNGGDILFLKYEDFFDNEVGDLNFKFIFEQLTNFLHMDISDDQKTYIKQTFCFDSQKKFSKQYKNFHEYDPKGHIHGHHLYKGKTGTWKELVSPEHYSILNEILGTELKRWGYE
jgi:hypothetical protein